MTRERLPAEERRRQILHTASRLFGEHGYRNTTTEMIAAAAEITEPILYRHFPGKAAIYLEALSGAAEELLQDWTAAQSTHPPSEWLTAMGDVYQRTLREGRWPALLQVDALTHCDDPLVRQIVSSHYTRIHAFVRDTIEKGQKAGAFNRGIDPDSEAWDYLATGLLLVVDELASVLPPGTVDKIHAARRARLIRDPAPAPAQGR